LKISKLKSLIIIGTFTLAITACGNQSELITDGVSAGSDFEQSTTENIATDANLTPTVTPPTLAQAGELGNVAGNTFAAPGAGFSAFVSSAQRGQYSAYLLNTIDPDGNVQQLEIGNVLRDERIAVIGDWIYFSGPNYAISRVSLDGSEQVEILDPRSASGYILGIIDNWIYFTNAESSSWIQNGEGGPWVPWTTDDSGEQRLWRVRTDGSDLTEILAPADQVRNILSISADWVFWQFAQLPSFEQSSEPPAWTKENAIIYRTRTDGTETQERTPDTWDLGPLWGFPNGEWIYTSSTNWEGNQSTVSRTNLVSGEIEEVGNIPVAGYIQQLSRVNDTFYVVSQDGDWESPNFTISKFTLGDDEATPIHSQSDYIQSLNVVNDWILFDTWSEAENSSTRQRVNVDGTGLETLATSSY